MSADKIRVGRIPIASGRGDAPARPYHEHRLVGLSYPWRRLTIAVAVVVLVMVVASGFGAIWIPPHTVAGILLGKTPLFTLSGWWPDSWETIVWQLRVPRILLGGLVGASLAVSGATYQGLFRNPLADPYLIGVASGAGLGATVVLGTPVPAYIQGFNLLPLAAFGGALLAVIFSYVIASRSGGLPLAGLILSGIAIASLASAMTGFLMIRSDPDVRPVLTWLMGSLSVSGWEEVRLLLPYLFVGVVGMMAYGRILNLMQLGEDEAAQIGVNVQRTKLVLVALASLTTAAAVSVSGLIGFVGLVAPHVVRLLWGHDYRFLIPMSLLVGAGFLVAADVVARVAARPSELPIGLVTAFCGAPFFLYVLQRSRRSQ